MKISKNAKIGIGVALVIGLIVAWKKGIFASKKAEVKKENTEKINFMGDLKNKAVIIESDKEKYDKLMASKSK